MIDGKHLYERAAGTGGGIDPLWHVEDGQAFFAGPLDYSASHQHSVPVYLAGPTWR